MRTVAEIDKQIQTEHEYIVKLYAQANAYEESIERLKKERKKAEEEELNNCKKCKYPCVNKGEDLKPITIDELRYMGYALCEEYTEEDI